MATQSEDQVLSLTSDEPLDIEGWVVSGTITVPYPDGSVWEHRSYQKDLDDDGVYEVITGRVLVEAATEPEPEEEAAAED